MGILTKILKQPFVKISSLNGVSVVIRIFGGLLTSKAIAAYVGSAGMALVGNLRDFLNSIEMFSTMGLQNGIIKYTAENEKNDEKLYKVLGTVFISLLGAILIISSILLVFADYCSKWLFSDNIAYAWVFKVLAFALPWYSGSLLFMAVLNGLGNYKQVILLNITGNVTGVALTVLLMWKFHTNGALLGLILFQALLFIFSFYAIWKRFPGMRFFKLSYFDFTVLKGLLSYSLMTVVTATAGPLVYIVIRRNLYDNFSPDTAGHWEAMNRISSFYMMFATTMLSVYFLPRLSMAQTVKDTKGIIINYYKSMLPLFFVGLTVLYFIRQFTVLFILKEEFLPMTDLFLWQLLGDFFKVGALILGYQFFAKKLTVAYIVTELLSYIILYLASIFYIKQYGAEGAVMAHAITYFIYWVILAVYFRKHLL